MIPKAIRDEAGLAPDSDVEVWVVQGRVHVQGTRPKARIERQGPFQVIVPEEAPPTLTAARVNREVTALREREIMRLREQNIGG